MSDLAKKLERLNASVRELVSAESEDQLAERILEVIEIVFGRNTAAVLLRKPGTNRLKIVAARGYDQRVVQTYHARVGEGIAGSVAASGKPRLVRDVTKERDYVRGVHQATSEIAVPLLVDGEVVGVIDVESRESAFGDEDMALLVAFGEQAAWAMRYGRVLTETRKRAHRMELLNLAARALNTVHDSDELLSRILDLAHRALGLDSVAVLVTSKRHDRLVVRKALNRDGVVGLEIPTTEGVTGAAFTQGKAEIVSDVTQDPRYIQGGLAGARSEMVAPLSLDGEIIGVLDAESAGGRVFDALDLEVFTSFAAHVATALRNAQLLQDLEDRARKLRLVTRSGRALNTIHDAHELIDEILCASDEALGLGRAAILLVDPEKLELVIHAARGYGDVLGKRIPIGQGITGHVALQGEPVLVRDVSKDPRYIAGIEKGASEMAVPLRVFGEIFGVLDTESPEPNAFDEQDLDLLGAFADQAAVAIHNARLFHRLEEANERLRRNVVEMGRLNKELEAYSRQISEININLELQVKQLTTLHQAGQTITSSLNLDETLRAILLMTGEILESSTGAIKLLDEETNELQVRAQSGVIEGKGPFLTYDLPLKVGERTIGVFEVVRQAKSELGESERQLLETLASQAAIAIENARLFEDTQRIYYETLKSLAKALETRDDYTRGHSERVAELSLAVGQDLALDAEECNILFNSALLHDIGKIGVRDSILLKPRQLTEPEMDIIRKHPTYGNAILSPLKFLGRVAELVNHHHERWDGKGYPKGLAGEAIPLASRIICIADAYDAMTSSRPYRKALSHEVAIKEMQRLVGAQFDPKVLESFLKVIERRLAKRSGTLVDP